MTEPTPTHNLELELLLKLNDIESPAQQSFGHFHEESTDLMAQNSKKIQRDDPASMSKRFHSNDTFGLKLTGARNVL